MTSEQLLTLARAYAAQTDLSLRQLGRAALRGNHKFFARLEAGDGVNTKSIKRAACWFAEHWPADLAWPDTVPHPHRPCSGMATPIPAPAHCDAAINAGVRRPPAPGRG